MGRPVNAPNAATQARTRPGRGLRGSYHRDATCWICAARLARISLRSLKNPGVIIPKVRRRATTAWASRVETNRNIAAASWKRTMKSSASCPAGLCLGPKGSPRSMVMVYRICWPKLSARAASATSRDLQVRGAPRRRRAAWATPLGAEGHAKGGGGRGVSFPDGAACASARPSRLCAKTRPAARSTATAARTSACRTASAAGRLAARGTSVTSRSSARYAKRATSRARRRRGG